MKIIFTVLFACLIQGVFAQIDFTPIPGNVTHCPGELKMYTSTVQGNCPGTRTWTVTNGKILDANNNEVTTLTGNSVNVRWNDFAGTGTLKVSVICGSEVKIQEKNYAIRSLKDRVLQNARVNQLPQYCSTNTIQLLVDEMLLLNTGGTTGIPQQFANGYEWTLPAGWSFNGASNTRMINIYPDNGCRGGTVTVKAYVNCNSGRKYSAPASISVARVGFNSSLGVPTGYTGPKCGNVSPVTFTAANLSCAQTYRWTATNTQWKDASGALGPWTTATNTLILYPSGTLSDQGIIAVDINIGCETLTQTYNAVYTNPPLQTPAFTLAGTFVLCSNGSSPLAVAPVASASTYNWYTVPAGTNNVLLNGTLATQAIPLVTSTPSITVQAPAIDVNQRFGLEYVVKANRAGGCAGSLATTRSGWVGNPDPGFSTTSFTGASCVRKGYTPGYEFYANPFPYTVPGATQYTWSLSGQTPGITISASTNQVWANISAASYVPSYLYAVSVTAQNSCGLVTSSHQTFRVYAPGESCKGGIGGPTAVYPNPADNTLRVLFHSQTGDDDPLKKMITPAPVSLKLYNDKQQLVLESTCYTGEATLDTSALPDGNYVLHVSGYNLDEKRNIHIVHNE